MTLDTCESCNQESDELTWFGVTLLCEKCWENAESMEDTDEYLRREYERER
jgi:hypothetical protein